MCNVHTICKLNNVKYVLVFSVLGDFTAIKLPV